MDLLYFVAHVSPYRLIVYGALSPRCLRHNMSCAHAIGLPRGRAARRHYSPAHLPLSCADLYRALNARAAYCRRIAPLLSNYQQHGPSSSTLLTALQLRQNADRRGVLSYAAYTGAALAREHLPWVAYRQPLPALVYTLPVPLYHLLRCPHTPTPTHGPVLYLPPPPTPPTLPYGLADAGRLPAVQPGTGQAFAPRLRDKWDGCGGLASGWWAFSRRMCLLGQEGGLWRCRQCPYASRALSPTLTAGGGGAGREGRFRARTCDTGTPWAPLSRTCMTVEQLCLNIPPSRRLTRAVCNTSGDTPALLPLPGGHINYVRGRRAGQPHCILPAPPHITVTSRQHFGAAAAGGLVSRLHPTTTNRLP